MTLKLECDNCKHQEPAKVNVTQTFLGYNSVIEAKGFEDLVLAGERKSLCAKCVKKVKAHFFGPIKKDPDEYRKANHIS